ncbi:MAG: glycoside hydrolase family 38 C-terminal domain-containing protein [Cyanobacteriota bacterium]|nr:glycoside hydrolase family 38 C-terminal domain-containing protein [Cyanobacteriota bacterium]
MPEPHEVPLPERIETIQSSFPLDLQPLWQWQGADGSWGSALADPWGVRVRPDWHARGLIIWPRGGTVRRLRLRLACDPGDGALASVARARLVLRWWSDDVELAVAGKVVHRGDLFDSACRWPLPPHWWQGGALELELRLRSPLHDEGALVQSRIELEPLDPADPAGILQGDRQALQQLRDQYPGLASEGAAVQVLGHAHLDLAWLWPVADTWQAAERTFASALALMERFPQLHFAHSTPALYAWLQEQRPALFARLEAAVAAGRFEPINGPWVETDCVLISSASLLRQFQLGQAWSRQAFPQLSHELAWLPDSFGFAAGLPAVARATGVRWFCTHKLAWNGTNPFPHRLFRWRSRCGSELLALMSAPIGTDAEPLAIERYRLQWQQATGVPEALWLPGVGDHGGGPTAEMLEQLALWQQQAAHGAPVAPQRHGRLRDYLQRLADLQPGLPVWRDELYLELHRGCATSRPDQKRHNRTLERLLREAELAQALALLSAEPSGRPAREAGGAADLPWRTLLFQQFHDILPGTSVPEVFDQAEGQWRAARRQASRRRDQALQHWLRQNHGAQRCWAVAQLQPLAAQPRCLRLPAGTWSTAAGQRLPGQPAAGGGTWVQLPALAGVRAQRLLHQPVEAAPLAAPSAIQHPVDWQPLGPGRWLIRNGLISAVLGERGLEQITDSAGRDYLAAPPALRRYRDAGEFWDAWDLAADYAEHPLPLTWDSGVRWVEQGPLCVQVSWRGQCGSSPVRLDGRLQAGSPWMELIVSVDWRQRHELLRFALPLAQPACRWASDTSGGVIERPAATLTPRETSRWEAAAISWLAAEAAAPGGGLGVLLDGPQGVSASPDALGVSLLRAPTWPDPSADNGWQRLRLALIPCPLGWRVAALPQWAVQFREPLWCRPLQSKSGAAAAQPLTLPALGADLVLLGLRPCRSGAGARDTAVISVQNLSSCRRRLELGSRWRLLERLDGLDQPLAPASPVEGPVDPVLRPWSVGFWRIAAAQG